MKLEKDITVKNIKKIYDDLIKEFETKEELVIDLSDVSRVDLSFAQLVIATGKKAREMKKVVRIKGVSSNLKDLFRLAGIKT